MIYRKRIKKSGLSVSLTSQFLKVEVFKRVWYFNLPNSISFGPKFHPTFKGVKDIQGQETVTHTRLRYRKTVDRSKLKDMAQAMQDYAGSY